MNAIDNQTGIYLAWPTSPTWKPIYTGSKTEVNDTCSNVGIASDSFAVRKGSYRGTFHGEVEFIPLAIVADPNELTRVWQNLLDRIHAEFDRVGQARQWFHTEDRARMKEIVRDVLGASGVDHQWVG